MCKQPLQANLSPSRLNLTWELNANPEIKGTTSLSLQHINPDFRKAGKRISRGWALILPRGNRVRGLRGPGCPSSTFVTFPRSLTDDRPRLSLKLLGGRGCLMPSPRRRRGGCWEVGVRPAEARATLWGGAKGRGEMGRAALRKRLPSWDKRWDTSSFYTKLPPLARKLFPYL